MKLRVSALLVAAVFLLPVTVWGLGADHPNEAVHNEKWPDGLADLVNKAPRVHGYFVNWEDIFFFQGDSAALNNFLDEYASLTDTQLKVVIHPGMLQVMSPWDKEPRDQAADWRLYASPFTRDQVQPGGVKPGPFVTRLDVYLGGHLKLEELRVPKNIAIESSGEVEAFIESHRPGDLPNNNEQIWLHVELRPTDAADPLDDAELAQPVASMKAAARLGEPVDAAATVAGKTLVVRSTLSASQDGTIRGAWELQASEPVELQPGGEAVASVISSVRTHMRLEMDEPAELAGTDAQGGWKWVVVVRPREEVRR